MSKKTELNETETLKKKANTHRQLTDKEFWGFVEAGGGIYNYVAQLINKAHEGWSYTRKNVRERCLKTQETTERHSDIKENVIDKAEVRLSELIDDPNPLIRTQNVHFALKNRGKNRGYTTKEEIEHSGSIQVITGIEVKK